MLPVLPVLVPLGAALLSLAAWGRPRAQRALGVAGTAGLLAAGLALFARVSADGVQVVRLGGWPSPFGIAFVADLLSAVLVVLAGVLGLAAAWGSLSAVDAPRQGHGYWPALHVLLAGVAGAFLTGDLFNLYVWFEVFLMASFVLLSLGGTRPQLAGAVRYVVMNLLSSTLFLAAAGLLYGMAGTLDLAELSQRLRAHPSPALVSAVAMVLLSAWGIKAAIFPVFAWLPPSYAAPPAPVAALFAGLLTKVGFYAMLRVFTLVLAPAGAVPRELILALAALTMVTGVLGAVAQGEIRRILAFHSVSQMGYMLLGLGLGTPLALAGSIAFLVHHSLVKSNLFLLSGAVERISGTDRLDRLGGLWASRAGLGIVFLVTAFSLAGIPPLSGFWAKLALLRAGVDAGAWGMVACAAAVGVLTLLSMTKIWGEAFWKAAPSGPAAAGTAAGARGGAAPAGPPAARGAAGLLLPAGALALLIVGLGLAAGPAMRVAERAAAGLSDPSAYVRAVLGPGGLR
jgi:multicomponent Na+:H+ antiporter subunit D